MTSPEILAETDVTQESLDALFKRAFFTTSYDSDGELQIQTDGARVIVKIDTNNKLLTFFTLYRFKRSCPLNLKHEFVNKVNDSIIFTRFYVSENEPEIFLVDYYLPYEEGIPAFQIISAIRLFSRVIPVAIENNDDNDLVR